MWLDLIPTAVVSVAAVLDLKWRRIPNWLTLGALGAGLLAQVARAGAAGVPVALGGAALGLLVLLPFYVLRAMGAGDVKLLAGVGSLVGPQALVSVMLYAALAGGLLSAVALVRQRKMRALIDTLMLQPLALRRSGITAPYGVAIASGVYLSMLLPSVIG